MPATRSSKPPRPPSRSRFQEGSMNDRTSATPPVHFIGPDSFLDVNDPRGLRTRPSKGVKPNLVSTIRPVGGAEDARVDGRAESKPAGVKTKEKTQEKTKEKARKGEKRGSKQLLGQVWDGVLEKFRVRKDHPPPAPVVPETKKASISDDRPSKEEIYANYHQLVASGFFTSHAIQSTRQPGPAQRPSTSQASGPAPAWPLPQLPLTPNKSRPGSPIKSPASASSRGTKRAKDDEEEEEEEKPMNKKIRKTVSTPRDLAIPKRRSSSRLNGPRTFSNRNISGVGAGATAREPNKLTKRVLNRLPLSVPDRGSSGRRNVSDMIPPAAAIHHDGSDRILRPRRSAADVGGLRVKPDTNRGIPSVPDIPSKFTYGEDRENAGPWRGLHMRRGVN